MLASQNIWLLHPFISGSNQYSKLICVQSCIYTFLLLIQISCSAYLEVTLLLLPQERWWQPSWVWLLHPVSGSSGHCDQGEQSTVWVWELNFASGWKTGGETKAKSEHRLHQNETGSSVHGGWGKGWCCRLPGSCSALPASLASSLASDFYFLLKRGETLKCSEELDGKSPACLVVMIWGHDAAGVSPPLSRSGRHPSCAMTYLTQGGHSLPCSQPCQGGEGEPHSFTLESCRKRKRREDQHVRWALLALPQCWLGNTLCALQAKRRICF